MASTPESPTGGVQAFPIGGRLVSERERLRGMTKEERQWRAMYVKDQILAHTEPKFVQSYVDARFNIIRRIYRYPLDCFGKALVPVVGQLKADTIRYLTGKFFIYSFCILATRYYFKYNQNNWERHGGWYARTSRPMITPGDANYPQVSQKKWPNEYADKGFSKSLI